MKHDVRALIFDAITLEQLSFSIFLCFDFSSRKKKCFLSLPLSAVAQPFSSRAKDEPWSQLQLRALRTQFKKKNGKKIQCTWISTAATSAATLPKRTEFIRWNEMNLSTQKILAFSFIRI